MILHRDAHHGDGGSRVRRVVFSACCLILAVLPSSWPPGPAHTAGIAHQTAAGSLRGRVEIRREPDPPARRPGVSDLGSPGARDLPDRRRAVVYLETAPGGAFEVSAVSFFVATSIACRRVCL